MIQGKFGEDGELIFEVELITNHGEMIPVEVLLDTGFTTGYLAVHLQDIEALGWFKICSKVEMRTAQGIGYFDIYQGLIEVDGQEFMVPVHVGEALPDLLIGAQWLDWIRLEINKAEGILTLEVKTIPN